VGALIGLPLAALILWIMGATGGLWWLWAWGAWVGFNLLLLVLYPTVIAPLFNKFEPLADESAEARVQALMQRCGFAAKGLFVMDGSKRSAHANAYFTGLGAAKRVVFFDTLLSRLSPGEVEAVLAHELGHFKHARAKRMVAIFGASLAGAGAAGLAGGPERLLRRPGRVPRTWRRPTTRWRCCCSCWRCRCSCFFVSPLAAQLSRRTSSRPMPMPARRPRRDLASALLKLHEDNAATLTPDPVYVRFYYSHPPASESWLAGRAATCWRGAGPLHGA
jgi:STE24 endopeptidase